MSLILTRGEKVAVREGALVVEAAPIGSPPAHSEDTTNVDDAE